jgi:hypothetical protein
MSTLAAPLRSVAGIYIHDTTALSHRLVGQELLKLKEVPLVHLLSHGLAQGLLPFGSFRLGQFPRTATNASEFFQHDGHAFFQSFNDLLGDAMVDVFPYQSFAPAQLLQVYPCGVGLLALQLSPQSLVSFAQLFYFSTTEEPVVADDSQLLHASVNADHLPVRLYIIALLLKNDVQISLVLHLEQVCRTSLPRKVLLEVFWDEDGQSHPARQSQDVDGVVGEVHRQGAVVVADCTTAALGTGNLLTFLFTSHYGSKGFCGFGSSGNGELGFQSRIGTDLLVGHVVQTNPIELLVVPSGSADEVESVSVCLKRWLKHLLINFQLQFSGSYLFHIPPVYMSGETDFLRQNPNFFPNYLGGGHSSLYPKGLGCFGSLTLPFRRNLARKRCRGFLPAKT